MNELFSGRRTTRLFGSTGSDERRPPLLVQKYLLYWYKSACFTGAKIFRSTGGDARRPPLLAQKYLLSLVASIALVSSIEVSQCFQKVTSDALHCWHKSTCFTGTKVLALLVQKDKNTDAEGCRAGRRTLPLTKPLCFQLNLYAAK